MRAGPLSNPKVIELLNRYFVPVVSSNGYAGSDGTAPLEERTERQRIYLEFFAKKLPVGDVHVYLMGPDAHAIEGVDIYHAAEQPGYLISGLEKTAATLKTVGGPPVVKPAPQSVPPPHDAGSMVFHLVARGDGLVSWHYGIPSENWIVLSAADWASLLPPAGASVGTSRRVDPKVASRLLVKFYPQTEETNPGAPERNRIDHQSLTMKIVSMKDGAARARIDASVRMKHSFAPSKKENDLGDKGNNFVDAKLAGFMDFSTTARRIDVLRLVTTEATYGNNEKKENFDATLRSMQPSQ